jgi:hypothetical protein
LAWLKWNGLPITSLNIKKEREREREIEREREREISGFYTLKNMLLLIKKYL